MAIELLTQQALRPLQRLPFCYICGRSIAAGDAQNRDHVPPSALFLREDRNFPLILPTHYECNHGRHVEDEQIGQLVGLLHGNAPERGQRRIDLYAGSGADGNPFVAAGGFDLRSIIRRWVRGFHAALYREPLEGENFMTAPPLAEADQASGEVDNVQAIVPHFVRAIRQNRSIAPLDRIVCRNGRCVYECVWLEADDRGRFCAYALDIYGWVALGDIERFGRRGCAGAYVLSGRRMPPNGREGISGDSSELIDPLDPFAHT